MKSKRFIIWCFVAIKYGSYDVYLINCLYTNKYNGYWICIKHCCLASKRWGCGFTRFQRRWYVRKFTRCGITVYQFQSGEGVVSLVITGNVLRETIPGMVSQFTSIESIYSGVGVMYIRGYRYDSCIIINIELLNIDQINWRFSYSLYNTLQTLPVINSLLKWDKIVKFILKSHFYMDMEIIQSNRGHPKVCHNGYMYVQKKVGAETSMWRCVRRATKCKGSIRTTAKKQDPQPIGRHNHDPNPD